MNRVLLTLLVSLFTFGFLGCGDDGGDMPQQIVLEPQNPVVNVGADVTLTAKQENKAISGGTWTTSDPAIATVTANTNGTAAVHGVAPGSATVKVTLGTQSAQVTVMVSPAALTGITVTPATPTIALGTTTQLTATATFEDGMTKDVSTMVTWASASTTIATVDSDGTVTSVAQGTGMITATLSGKTGSATVTVTDAALTSIDVTPANPTLSDGQTQQMTATGHFTDDTTQDISSSVTWTSATAAAATVSATGLVTAVDPGTSVVTASLGAISGNTTVTVTAATLTSIDVTPANPSIADGLTQQMTATGHYSDASMQNLTAMVTWSSATTAKATISTGGLVTAVDPGTSVITATMGTVSGTTTVTVTAKALTSIDVTPSSPMITDGSTQQMTATGHYTDNSTANITTTVTWTSATPAKATISTGGLVTAVDPGTSVITATSGTISGTTTVTVTAAALTSITVTPANPTIPDGLSQQMTATGHYTDGSTPNLTAMVTWSSATPAKATITAAGVVTAVDPGTSVITATLGTIAGSTTVTVGAPDLVSIEVTPANPMILDGDTRQMTATGHYTDNSTQNLTATVTWSSGTTATATISTAGLVTAVDPGTSIIKAALGAISGQTTVTVTAATLTSIEVTPVDPSLADGLTVQLTATGHYSDNTTQNISSQVTWTSATEAAATVSTTGLVTAVDPGTSVITATSGALMDSTTVTVTAKELVSIEITPANPEVTEGATLPLTATGHYTDNSTADLTTMVTWSSATLTAATISTNGLVTGVDPGTSEITATLGAVSGTTTVTVTAITVTPPTVTATSPADATTEQSASTAIGVTFDMAMNPATLTAQASEGMCSGSLQVSSDNFATCIGLGAIATSAGDTVATATPATPLSCGVTYKIRVTTAAMTPGGAALAGAFTTATGFKTIVGTSCATGRVIISQVYGGGGAGMTSGATFNADFIELHNVSNVPVSLNGMSVQYTSVTGGSWQARPLPNAVLPAGAYYLIQTTTPTGTTGGAPLPIAVDFKPTSDLAMSATNGKVLLSSQTAGYSVACPTTGVIDLLGFGPTANCSEGTPTAVLSNTTGAVRNGDGCTDTDHNNTDFTLATPSPRNTATTALVCANPITLNETNLPEELDFCSLLSPASISVATATATPAILGKVYEVGVTEAAGASASVVAQVGYGPANTNPEFALGWTWSTMTYDSQAVNDDVYTATFTAPAAGTYAYTTRFSVQGGANWTYCDLDGAGSNAGLTFSATQLGVLTVTP